MPETITIHTDGACPGNPGPGGFAAILEHQKGDELIITGGDPQTTNNRMELSAVIEALRAVNSAEKLKDSQIEVRSDSQYVTNAFNDNWIAGWQRRNWQTSKGDPVLNRDLWEELLHEVSGHQILWTWVKGHNGDPMNERCDRLAVEQAQAARSQGQYLCITRAAPVSRTGVSPEPQETGAGQLAKARKLGKNAYEWLDNTGAHLRSGDTGQAQECIENAKSLLRDQKEALEGA